MRWTVDADGWWYGTPEGSLQAIATILPIMGRFSGVYRFNDVGRFDDLDEAKRACEAYHAKRGGSRA